MAGKQFRKNSKNLIFSAIQLCRIYWIRTVHRSEMFFVRCQDFQEYLGVLHSGF